MSGIAVAAYRDGRPVAPAEIGALLLPASRRGPDGSGFHLDGSVALVQARLAPGGRADWSSAEPVCADGVAVAWDGRLDNRDELLAVLAEGPGERLFTDAALVARAYRRWGLSSLERLAGDFAFVLWDRPSRRLLCARDPLGRRPFHYYLSESTFVGASDAAGVLAHPSVPRAVNEGMVAEYLAGSITSVEETLYAAVSRLPPGGWLTLDPAGVRRGAIDWIDPAQQITYAREEEYAEHLRELLREAVRVRIENAGAVACEVSGGLDSCTVAGAACDLLGADAPHQLTALSLVFPSLPCDERAHIERFLHRWNVAADLVDASSPPAPDEAADDVSLDFPYHPNGIMSVELRRRARARGTRVILTGIGGDEWFTGSRRHFADHLRGGRFARLARDAWGERQTGRGVGPTLVWDGIWPNTPGPLKQAARVLRGPVPLEVEWLPDTFINRTALRDRIRAVSPAPGFPTFAQRDMWAAAFGGWTMHGVEMENRLAADLGVELRHPLCDLRIARFGLAIPEELRWRGAERKRVLRAAAAGLVPDELRSRHDKPDFTPLVVRALDAHGGTRFFERLGIAERGWVRGSAPANLYRQMRRLYEAGDPQYMRPAWILWMICGIERWTRALDRAATPAPQVRAATA